MVRTAIRTGWLAVMLALAGPVAAQPPQRVVSMNLCTDQLAMMLAGPGQLISVSHLGHDPAVSPPRALYFLGFRGGGRLVAAARGAHAPAPKHPGTVQAESRHGALSSTANVTSMSAVSAAVRCGSAIS